MPRDPAREARFSPFRSPPFHTLSYFYTTLTPETLFRSYLPSRSASVDPITDLQAKQSCALNTWDNLIDEDLRV